MARKYGGMARKHPRTLRQRQHGIKRISVIKWRGMAASWRRKAASWHQCKRVAKKR
jgi:hypothetical protein